MLFHPTSPADLLSRDAILSMSGLTFMERMLAGELASPPIGKTLNYWVTRVADGEVDFQGAPGFESLNPLSGTHGGWYGTVLDSCMACAVMTKVPQGSMYTTLEYKVNLNRAIPMGTQVIASGVVDHAGRSTATSHGEIRGLDGTLYATGSTTCLIMKLA